MRADGGMDTRVPTGTEILRTRSDRSYHLPSLLYSGYQVFRGGRGGRDVGLPPPQSSAEVLERVELYLYSP